VNARSSLVAVGLLCGLAHAQAPVLNPRNGHYYEVVATSLDWNGARADAESRSHLGASGHLVTFAGAEEDDWVYDVLAGGPLGNAWIGLYQDMTAPDYSEPAGGWRWVTGEPLVYLNWKSGEPNDGGGAEHYGGYWAGDEWNDYRLDDGAVVSFVVEFDVSSWTHYCVTSPNSVGSGAIIWAEGTSSVSANALTLGVSGVPDQFGVFLFGSSRVQTPFGDGFLCLRGGIQLLYPPRAASGGEGRLDLDLATAPLAGVITAGSTWNFQHMYRDPGFGVAMFNLSDGLEVVFAP